MLVSLNLGNLVCPISSLVVMLQGCSLGGGGQHVRGSDPSAEVPTATGAGAANIALTWGQAGWARLGWRSFWRASR